MKLLIIGDLHHRVNWVEPFLKGQTYDKVIFLGDYQDQFHDNANDASLTARWMKEMLKDDRNVLLFGNHDISYRFPKNGHLWCPGFDENKARAINSVLTQRDWNKMELVHFEDDFVFCHGGILMHHFAHPVTGELTKDIIINKCEKAMEDAKGGLFNPILSEWGPHRGDRNVPGGIIWADWHEVEPLKDFKLIVGHTPAWEPRIKKLEVDGKIVSYAACLDTVKCGWYATIDNGVFVLHKNPYSSAWTNKDNKKVKSGMTDSGYGVGDIKSDLTITPEEEVEILNWIKKIK